MWNLKSVSARNVMSFVQMDYEIHQGVTTLVFGENLDNDSQKSNGSGKSSLLECLSIGFTGSPMRKVKNEEVINDAADDCEVVLDLVNQQLNERMVITRRLFRKGSSVCSVDLYRDGCLVETDESKKSSVEEYNKYILAQLGVTRDELYNNFLLSKHKFQDFLSSSDKDKKDIINRFSNGNKVDEAIAKVQEDKSPYVEKSRELELKRANLSGKCEVVAQQIEEEKDDLFNRQNNLEGTIVSIQNKIAEQRSSIRQFSEDLNINEDDYNQLIGVETQINQMSDHKPSVIDAYELLVELFSKSNIKGLSNWKDKAALLHNECAKLENEQAILSAELLEADIKRKAIQADIDAANGELEKFEESFQGRVLAVDDSIRSAQTQINKEEEAIAKLTSSSNRIQAAISEIQSKLAGTITCPKCSHQFILADESFEVEKAKSDLTSLSGTIDNNKAEIASLVKSKEAIEADTLELGKKKRALSKEKSDIDMRVQEVRQKLRPITSSIASMQSQLKTIEEAVKEMPSKIESLIDNMYKEAYSIMDDLFAANDKEKSKIENSISDANGRIEALEANIVQIRLDAETDNTKSLQETLAKLKNELEGIDSQKRSVDAEIKKLEIQEQRFVEFKTYLANTKIEALSVITNEFLEHIGSDIRIKFSGYTALKSGKVRDKISISLLRNGIDCGSYGKFSEGEKARANLASILAMQRLVNSNCELDRGLDLILLDEILESVDEDGLANMFKVLNKLEITAIVVSHGLVSESYPYKLIVTKENGESTLRNAN